MRRKRRKNSKPVEWIPDHEIKNRVYRLIDLVDADWIRPESIYCVRSTGSSARAYARIWGMNKIWQIAAGHKPSYVIEVLSEHFDKLNQSAQDKVLLHELAHIPKNFSGSLVAHNHTKGGFHDKLKKMEALYDKLK